jgi:hypothetical protein
MKAFGGRSGGNTIVTMVVDPSLDEMFLERELMLLEVSQ